MQIARDAVDRVNVAYRASMRGVLTPGVVYVTEEQFAQIGHVVPEYRDVATARQVLDVDDLHMEMVFADVDGAAWIIQKYLEPHVRDMLEGLRFASDEGRHLVFATEPTVHLERKAYEVHLFAWLHVRIVLKPREDGFGGKPIVVKTDIQEARRMVREAADAASRAGAPNYHS